MLNGSGNGVQSRSASEIWLSTARTMQQKTVALETAIESMLHRLETRNETDLKQILCEKTTLEKQRRSRYEPILSNIDAVRLRVRQIGELIECSDVNDLNEQHRVQEKIDELVCDIAALKNDRALEYDVMNSQYAQTSQSIAGLIQKYELNNSDQEQFVPGLQSEQSPITTPQPSEPAGKADNDAKSSILSEISKVEKIIDIEGGSGGGWDENDHRHFLKLWNSLNHVEDICNRGMNEIYGQTYQTVLEHCKWFDRYLGYVARKKELIAEWRAIKDAEKKKTIKETDAALTKATKDRPDESSKQSRQEKEAALRKWKEEKAQQELEKSLREAESRARADNAERQRRERRAQVLHEKIEKFHEQNKSKDTKENNQPKKVEIDEGVIQKIHIRNSALISRRKSLIDSKRTEQIQKTTRTASLAAKYRASIRVETDPDRLLKATKATEIRTMAREKEKSDSKPGANAFIISAQHRAVPQWRRGV